MRSWRPQFRRTPARKRFPWASSVFMFWGVAVLLSPAANYVGNVRHERVLRQIYVDRDAQDLAAHQVELAAQGRLAQIVGCLQQGGRWDVTPPGNETLEGSCSQNEDPSPMLDGGAIARRIDL